MYMQPSFSSKQRRQCRAQRPKKSLDRRHVRGRSRKNACPRPPDRAVAHETLLPLHQVMYRNTFGMCCVRTYPRNRERERYSSMRYFQFLFRYRGCASGSAFTCSYELPPSAGPVLTYLGTVPYLSLFRPWLSHSRPGLRGRSHLHTRDSGSYSLHLLPHYYLRKRVSHSR